MTGGFLSSSIVKMIPPSNVNLVPRTRHGLYGWNVYRMLSHRVEKEVLGMYMCTLMDFW